MTQDKSNAKKTSNNPSKVWIFGITEFLSYEDKEVLADQFYHSTKYYNDLLSIAKEKAIQFNELRKLYVPGLNEAEELVEQLSAKLDEEGTQNELKTLKSTLKKYKQAKKSTEAKRCEELIKQLNEKLISEGTLKELNSVREKVKLLKKRAKDLKNKEELVKIKEQVCISEGVSYQDYKDTKKIGPDSDLRKKIKSRILEEIAASDVLSDFDKKDNDLEKIKIEKSKKLSSEYLILSSNTRSSIEKSLEQAQTKKKNIFLVKWKRFDGSGKCSNQLSTKGNVTARDIFSGKCSYISIKFDSNCDENYSYDDDRRWDTRIGRTGSSLGNNSSATLTFRIGTGKDSKLIKCKTIIHRKIPPDVLVKYAAIKAVKCGPVTKYNLLLTLEGPHFNEFVSNSGEVVERPSNKKIIALDVGWRECPDGSLRAGCVGDANSQEMIYVSDKIVSSIKYAEDLRSVRDKIFNDAKKIFSDLLHLSNDEELKEKGKHIHNTRSPKKLVPIINHYRNKCINTKEMWEEWRKIRLAEKKHLLPNLSDKQELYNWFISKGFVEEIELHWLHLEWWARQNKHLYQMESNIRSKALKYRREEYRKIAKRYAESNYGICVEDFDKSKVATQENRINKTANSNRTIVCTSELVNVFKNAFYGRVKKIDPKFSSSACHSCGYNLADDPNYEKGKLIYICPKCNAEWDRDVNAVINIVTYADNNWDTLTSG